MTNWEQPSKPRGGAWPKIRTRIAKWLKWSAVVMIATYLAFAIPFWTRSPAVTKRFVSDFNKEIAATPEETSAWPLLRRAILATEHWDEKEFPKGPPESTSWDDPQFAACNAHIESWHEAIKLVRDSSAKSRLGHFLGSNDDVLWEKNLSGDERLRINAQVDLEATPLLFMMSQPWMGSIRKFTRAFALDMDIAAAERRSEQVVEDLEAICLLANLASDPPLIVSQLLSDAMRMLAAERFGRELAAYPGLFSPAQLDRAAAILTRAGSRGQIDLEWEKRSTEDLAQHVFSDDGYGDGLMTIEGWNLLTELAGKQRWGRPMIIAVGPLVAKSWGTRSQFDQFLSRVYQEASAHANKPPWERTRSWLIPLESAVNADDAPRSSFIVFAALPALPKAFAARSTAQMVLQTVVSAIAAERFRLEHSRFPRSEAEMASAMGFAPPMDVFDGKAIRFRFDGDGFAIYSVGADRVDNGGERTTDGGAARKWIHAEELLSLNKAQRDAIKGDWVLWPPNEVEWADGTDHPLQVQTAK